MRTFRDIKPEQLTLNPFQSIGADWMLITPAREGGGANPMTASWGGMGILWRRPVVFLFIRPSRFTRELIDGEQPFSVDFLDGSYRRQLDLCGSKSGRDLDKIEACGFDLGYAGEVPYILQSHTVLVCRKLYRQPLEAASFLDHSIPGELYPKGDYSVQYVAEIQRVLVADQKEK